MIPTFTSRPMALLLALFLTPIVSFAQQPELISLSEDRVRHMLSDFNGQERTVEICDLKVGETYRVWAVQTDWCQPLAKLNDGDYATTFDFVADSDCLEMTYSKGDTPCNGDMFLSLSAISLNKKKSFQELVKASALFVDGGYEAESLIKDIFIGGGCFDIENVQAIGPDDGRGRFGSGASTVAIESGVILSSGNVATAMGPNNSNSAGTNIGGGSDPDLQLISSANVFDAVGIEFEFTPTVDSMTFEFAFASEEYCEYVNSSFNDIFGFFISGPGISGPFSNGGANIATLPNGTPVTINNVNHLANTGFFVANQGNCGGFSNIDDIQFDGYTVPLQAKATLIACETYTIRLVVGDAGDGIFDSAVFLKANSFTAGNALTGEALSGSTGTNLIYEACNDGTLYFFRAAGDVGVPLIYDVVIDPASTATPGLDYSPLPAQIVIPAGETFVQIPLNVVDDGIPEGIEEIILLMDNTCSCDNDQIIIQIADSDPIEVAIEGAELCIGEIATLDPSPVGGTGNYMYQWSDGSTDPILVVVPPGPPTYAVTVTDNCGSSATTSTTIIVNQTPTAQLTGDPLAFICEGDMTSTVDIQINFTGNAPWTFVYTIDGATQPPVTTSVNPYIISTNTPGTYQLEAVTSAADCEGTAVGVAVVSTVSVEAELEPQPSTCILGGTLFASLSGGAPMTYQWSDPTLPNPNGPVQVDVFPGTYSVTITDLNGCTAEDEATVEVIEPLEASSSFTNVDCSSGNAGTIDIEATSGSEPISYNWSNSLPNQPNQTGLPAGTYYVTIFDNIGCTIMDTMEIMNNSVPPAAEASTMDILDCTILNTEVLGTGSATGTNISYQWTGPGIVFGANEINATVNASGTYTLVVTDNDNGCTSTDETVVDVDITPPEAAAVGDEISCTVDEVQLNGAGSTTGNVSYLWTGPGIVSGETTLTPTVDAAGTYTLTVTNLTNGCTDEATADVTQDSDLPTAIILDPVTLDCNTNSLTLDGSGSSSGSTITYQWYLNGAELTGETSTSLGVTGPGNYEILVSDGDNGCDANYAVDVIEDLAPPQGTAIADGQITCTIEQVGLIANVPGNPSDYTYSWGTADGSLIGGINAQNATAGSTGNYEVTITNSFNGCTSTSSVPVTQDASIPLAEIEPADELDCLINEFELDGTNSTQGPNLTYTWTTSGGGNITAGQNTLTPTINAAGTYTLTIFDPSNGCESEDEITVTQDDVLPDLAVANAPILDCDVESLIFDATVSNFVAGDLDIVWTTSDGTIVGANDILNAEANAPGTYTLTVTNPLTGCTDEETVIVDEDITPPVPIISNPDELTCTTNTVTLDAGLSSSGSNFSYEWTTVTGNIVSGGNTLNPVVNQDGEYILTITNTTNNCTDSAPITVEQNADVPQAEAGLTAEFTCDTDQLTLTGSGSIGPEYTYAWTGPGILNGGNSLTPLVDEPGMYELIVTNSTNQCTAVDNVTLGTDFAEPTAEAGLGGQLSCSVTAMSLDGTGSSTTDVTYLWTSPDGSIVSGETTLSPEINAPGTYVLQVTNTLNGCTTTDDVLIEEDDDLPSVDIDLAPPITCNVVEITLDGTGTQTGTDFTYVWGTSGGGNIVSGANTLEPIVNQPGTYALTVTNTATNCTNIGTVTVGEETDPPAVEAGQTYELDCIELSTDLNGGGSATGADISYLWSTSDGNILSGETTLTPTVDDPGTYTLLVTNSTTGCTNEDDVIITESNDVPSAVTVAFGDVTCVVDEVQISGAGSSFGLNFTYGWTTSDGNIVAGNDEIVAVVSEPGTYLLTVTNLDNSCTATQQVIVLEDTANPTAEAGMAVDLSCDVQTLGLDGTGSSSGTDISYAWTTNDGVIVSGANTLNPTIGQVGTYLLTVTDTDNGCTSTDEVIVGQDLSIPTALIAPPATLTCGEISFPIIGTASQGAEFEFNWTTTDGNIVSGETTLEPVVDEPGTYTLFVINNLNGCTNEAEVVVSEDIEEPEANAGLDFLMDCQGNFPSLSGLTSSGNGTLSYSWETLTGIIESGENTAEPTVSLAGTYVLTVTDAANGCTDVDEVIVSTNGPTAEPESLQPGCYGELGAIVIANVNGGSSPYLFSIDGGNTFSNDAIHTNLSPGTYEIIVQDDGGCEDIDVITIQQPGIFEVEIEDFAAIDQGDEYQLDVQINVPVDQVAEIIWNPSHDLSCTDCLDPLASPEQSTVYHVTVITKEGCEDDAVMLLEVNEAADVYFPTGFSPNGDKINDVFMVYTDEDKDLKVKSLRIYSRWGETVFQLFNFLPNDPTYGWDGYHRGDLMNPAVFVWVAEIEFEDGRVELFQGDVTLMNR